jgi:hypothetical protein
MEGFLLIEDRDLGKKTFAEDVPRVRQPVRA